MIYHKHSACVQESRLKNLGELFFRHIYRNGRKHILISILFYIFATASFLGGLWNGRHAMHPQDVHRPFLSIHINIRIRFHLILFKTILSCYEIYLDMIYRTIYRTGSHTMSRFVPFTRRQSIYIL